ncbi:Synaptotagmin-7 [Trachymyrmex septentrionalis]|uniref:Synaptotagmin-7 n=2 Tax=Apocrita TaxID=7400 RepID=A0A195ESI0_9HYME|nr:Synaptotagmin-7 [Trachymyrmex septentrionalis]
MEIAASAMLDGLKNNRIGKLALSRFLSQNPDAAERKMRNIYRGYILHIGCGERIRSSRFDRVIFLRDKSPHCCCRVMALRRIGSTIAHKSKSSYLRPSYVLVLQANETLWKKVILIIFVVNCLPLILRPFEGVFVEAVFSLVAVSLDSSRDSFREQRGGANVSKAGWTGRPDTRRKASVSDATSLRSDRSDLTRAPPSYDCQAQQDARSSDSSRARSTVICVACPAAGPCLRYGRTSDRRAIARKYDARGPYDNQPDGNWCDAAMRRRENTMPVRNAIGERKRGFAVSRLVPELAQTSLLPASYEVGAEVYMQIWGGRYNRRYAVKKGRERIVATNDVIFFSGDVADIYRCGHKGGSGVFRRHYHDNSYSVSITRSPKVQRTLRFRVYRFTRVFQDTFASFLIAPFVLPDSQWKRNFGQKAFLQSRSISLVDMYIDNSEPSENVGQIHFSLEYDFQNSTLILRIIQGKDLPAKDLSGTSDPYVRVTLLPDKKHRLETKIKRRTLNPRWNETFYFEGFPIQKLQSRVLHLHVFDYDRFSRDDSIGEMFLPLCQVDLSEKPSFWKALKPPAKDKCGELLCSLCYHPSNSILTLTLLKARNLKAKDINGKSDPYVKVWLQFGDKRIEKRKTPIFKCTLNPVFNEVFSFNVPWEKIRECSLDVMVMDFDNIGRNELIGRIQLAGKNGSGASETKHWQDMITKPRQTIVQWHRLKPE